MQRSEFEQLVERARRLHPRWFELNPDTPVDAMRLAAIENTLGARLPEDYAWFLRTYGGGDFVFAGIYSGDDESSFFILDNQDENQPPETVAFSDNGCGDLFVFPVVDGVAEDTVLFLDHETGELSSTEYDGFLDFAEREGLHPEQ
jgi:SUKH superfamily protein